METPEDTPFSNEQLQELMKNVTLNTQRINESDEQKDNRIKELEVLAEKLTKELEQSKNENRIRMVRKNKPKSEKIGKLKNMEKNEIYTAEPRKFEGDPTKVKHFLTQLQNL